MGPWVKWLTLFTEIAISPKGRVKKPKTSDFVWTGGVGGGSENYPLCLNPISEVLIWLLGINFISKLLNFNLVFSSMVCFGLLTWSKMYKYQHQSCLETWDFVPNICVVYNWILPFWKCWSNIKMLFCCITAFKVKQCS